MKSFVAIACIAFIVSTFAFVAQSAAVPVAETDVAEADVAETDVAETNVADENAADTDVEHHVLSRHKRITCDLMSFSGVNHSACAAHCIAKNYRGGYCNDQAVCVCRN